MQINGTILQNSRYNRSSAKAEQQTKAYTFYLQNIYETFSKLRISEIRFCKTESPAFVLNETFPAVNFVVLLYPRK